LHILSAISSKTHDVLMFYQ